MTKKKAPKKKASTKRPRRRSTTLEAKQAAVRRHLEEGIGSREIAREMGVHQTTFLDWRRKYAVKRSLAKSPLRAVVQLPVKAARPTVEARATTDDLYAVLGRLMLENEALKRRLGMV